MKKWLCAILTLALLLSVMAGCGNKQPENADGDSIEESQTAPQNETEAGTEPPTEAATEAPTQPQDEAPANDALWAVLDGICPIVTPEGQSESLHAYLASQYDADAAAYVMLDFDQDGQNEMVILTDSPEASYVVLYYYESSVFAAVFGARQMQSLKVDGSFIASASAYETAYCTLRFVGGRSIVECAAEGDSAEGVYSIGDGPCTDAEFSNFGTVWNTKADVAWIFLESYEPEPIPTESSQSDGSYLLEIPRADQPIYDGPGYDYSVVGTVEVAGVYTIVEERWDYEGNLWGKLKSGAGWVNLTDIQNDKDNPPLITVSEADDTLLNSGAYEYFHYDDEYARFVAFRTYETMYDVTLWTIDAGQWTFSTELYYTPWLEPDWPLVAKLSFPGDMSCYGISFYDADGNHYRYVVGESGRNGELGISPW